MVSLSPSKYVSDCTHITVQGRIQHWQSSPHQHGSLTGGFVTGPFAKDVEDDDVPEEAADDVVEGGIAVVVREMRRAFVRRDVGRPESSK